MGHSGHFFARHLGREWAEYQTLSHVCELARMTNRQAQVTNALNSSVTQTVEGQFFRKDRVTLWDNRVGKKFKIREGQTFEVGVDLYNTLNTNAVTSLSTLSSSSAYLKPTDIIPARIAKLGAKWKF